MPTQEQEQEQQTFRAHNSARRAHNGARRPVITGHDALQRARFFNCVETVWRQSRRSYDSVDSKHPPSNAPSNA